MRKTTRRYISLLLTAVLLCGFAAVAPIAAAEPVDYTLHYNKRDGKFYKEDTYDTEVISLSGWSGSGDTLTLDGFMFVTSMADAMVLPDGVTLNLSGTNDITSTNVSTGTSYGLSAVGDLTIDGDGTLNITQSDSFDSDFAMGLNVAGNLEVTGGEINATSTSNTGTGVYVEGNLRVSGGTLKGDCASGLRGVVVDGATIVSGTGKIIAIGLMAFYGASEPPNVTAIGSTDGTDTNIQSLTWDDSGGIYTLEGAAVKYVEITTAVADYTLHYNKVEGKFYKEDTYDTEVTDLSGWNGSGDTLTLDGFTFVTSVADVMVLPDDVTLNLSGTNIISSFYADADFTYGLSAEGDLTISGNGTLNVEASTSTGFTVVTGLYVEGDLEVTGGAINATAPFSVIMSIGVDVRGDLHVSGGTLKGEGIGFLGGESRGVFLGTDMSVSGTGKIIGIGDRAFSGFFEPQSVTAIGSTDGTTANLQSVTWDDNKSTYTLSGTNATYVEITVGDPEATAANVAITGTVGTPLVSGKTATITLINETLLSELNSEFATSWFSGLPSGVGVIATGEIGGTEITLTFNGTPTSASTAAFDITIPGSILASGEDLVVTETPAAKWDIKEDGGEKPDPGDDPVIPPYNPPAKPTFPGNDGDVRVNYSEDDGEVKIELPGSKIDELIDSAEDGTVTVDISGVKDAESAVFNVNAAESFADAEVAVTITLPAAEITLNPEALAILADTTAISTTPVTVEAKTVSMSELSGKQAAQVKGYETVVNIDVFVGDEKVDVPVTVSLPYKLKTNEDPNAVCVWYLDDNGNMTRLNGVYNEETGMITFTVPHQSYFVVGYDPAALWENIFTDITPNDWFYDAVAYANYHGYVDGFENEFKPFDTFSRATFVTLIWKLEGKPTYGAPGASRPTFNDVPDGMWYTNAVYWAAEQGIVTGTGNGFNPSKLISRQEMITMLYNYLQYKGYSIPAYQEADYEDGDDIASWAADAVIKLANAGVLSGFTEETLTPAQSAIRAELAQLFMDFLRLIAGK